LAVDIPASIQKAIELIISGDPELYGIVYRTLLFSGAAAIIATLWGTPIAMAISLKDFRGKNTVKAFINSLIGIPTVVLGLVLFLAFSNGGPLGFLGLLYTPSGIIIGEAILVTPIIISIATSAIEAVDPDIMNLAKTLGASESQASIAVLKEAVNGVLLSNFASFNRAVAELGVALLVGGNIAGSGLRTDVLTTAISRYTQRGEFDLAIALGIILMLIVIAVNMTVIIARKAKMLLVMVKPWVERIKK
jgi:tungstate transport system permease protein